METTTKSLSETKNTGKKVGSKNQVKVTEVESEKKLTVDDVMKLSHDIFTGESIAAEELAKDPTFQRNSYREYLYGFKNLAEAHVFTAMLKSILMMVCSEYGEAIWFEVLTTQIYPFIECFSKGEYHPLKFKDYSLFYDNKLLLNPHMFLKIRFPKKSELAIKLRKLLDILFHNQELIPDYISCNINNYPEKESLRDFILDFSEMTVVSSFREDIVNQKFLYNYACADKNQAKNSIAFLLPQDVPSEELERKHYHSPNDSSLCFDKYLIGPDMIIKKYDVFYKWKDLFTPRLEVSLEYIDIFSYNRE